MIGKVSVREVETQVVPACREILWGFSSRELRLYAKSIGVETGRNKSDTIGRLVRSGKATVLVQLGD